jgi:hypothetical protein
MNFPFRVATLTALASLLAAHGSGQVPPPSYAIVLELTRALEADSGIDVYSVIVDAKLHWPLAGRPLLDSLAAGLGAVVATAHRLPLPACPWDTRPQTTDHRGYWLYVADPSFREDTATVAVGFRCDNPPGFLHDIFWKEEEFRFQRTEDGWQLVRRTVTTIT